jgi:hypothetical protein
VVISNYEIIAKIAEDPRTAVFKGFHKKDPNRLLVIKILKGGGLTENRKALIRQKIEHLKVITDPLAITPISFGDKDGVCFIESVSLFL